MANRRMLSKTITHSARFLMLPASVRDLYNYLNQETDDDGFVSAYPVMNMIRSSDDDLQILVDKGYAILCNDEYLCRLPHFKINNSLKHYNKGDYLDEYSHINLIGEGKSEISPTSGPKAAPLGPELAPQVRLGKVRLDQVKKEKSKKENSPTSKPPQEEKADIKPTELKVYFEDPELNQRFLDFLSYKKQIKKPLQQVSIDSMAKKLIRDYEKDDILWLFEDCISNGYQGLCYDKLAKAKKESPPKTLTLGSAQSTDQKSFFQKDLEARLAWKNKLTEGFERITNNQKYMEGQIL